MDKLTIDNMDIYYPITQKRDLITKIAATYFTGKFLDLGCGVMPYKKILQNHVDDYVGMDIENATYQKNSLPDMFWDGKKIPLEDSSFDHAMLIEVLEHVPKPIEVLTELQRVLKKDGYVLITVPFLWPLHDVPYDEYRYTPFSLKKICEESGFEVVKMESFGGWNSSLATVLSLYLKRYLRKKRFSRLISRMMLPVIKYLYKKDENIDKSKFTESQMITGLWCLLKNSGND